MFLMIDKQQLTEILAENNVKRFQFNSNLRQSAKNVDEARRFCIEYELAVYDLLDKREMAGWRIRI